MEKVQLILQLFHPYTFIPTSTVIREMRVNKDYIIFSYFRNFVTKTDEKRKMEWNIQKIKKNKTFVDSYSENSWKHVVSLTIELRKPCQFDPFHWVWPKQFGSPCKSDIGYWLRILLLPFLRSWHCFWLFLKKLVKLAIVKLSASRILQELDKTSDWRNQMD